MIHAGIPKAASSSIQSTLLKNNLHSGVKYYYPRSLSLTKVISMFSDTLDKLEYPKLTLHKVIQNSSTKAIKKMEREYFKELDNKFFETLVFSNEWISSQFYSKNSLIKLKSFLLELNPKAKILIFAYVRNPLDFYTSAKQQLIKMGETCELNDKMNILAQSIFTSLPLLADVFGKDNMYVYKLEDTICHSYGPVGFFLEKMLRYNHEELQLLKIVNTNSSMSQIAVDICSHINMRTTSFSQYLNVQPDFEMLYHSISGNRFCVSQHERKEQLPFFKTVCNLLKDEFNIHYAIDEISSRVISDPEPNHVPSLKNIKEIKDIFHKLTSLTQNSILDYLENIFPLYDRSHFINIIVNSAT